ncbi:MAG: phosphoribosyl-ATP diphosphatase [Planctomycetota bacterium]
MIIPSIDLSGGTTVQLVGGEDPALDAGDPRPLLERFARVGETAVIDIDAARGDGDNRDLIEELCRRGPVRVGGGIRSVEDALRWLDAGARRVILGTAATPEILGQLPRERVIAAVDARAGEVVVEGWRKDAGEGLLERVRRLAPYVGGFLVTFVEREGRLGGTDLERARQVARAAGDAKVTIAGGVTTTDEIAALDALGADAQVGMALYTGRFGLAEAFAAPLSADRADGLLPTVVTDAGGQSLGLAWSSLRSLEVALTDGVGAYESRKRGLWVKGRTSGATQRLLRVEVDCDRDALRFVVEQAGVGFCHEGTTTCFGPARGVPALEERVTARVQNAPEGSYTARLLGDDALLASKLAEEAAELAEAKGRDEVVHEAADVLYFAQVAMARAGVRWVDVEAELDRRALKVTRRGGDAKPAGVAR